MDIFDILTLLGGLSLFLFGMNIMGQFLERRAGGKLRPHLGRLTTGRAMGLLTGLGVTAVIQSSSATTVMVIGFVNSGLMSLKQAANVIMGANIGTTVTAWVLSLAGIDSGSLFIRLLKPSAFTPALGFIGILLLTFAREEKKKDTSMVLLGFATLMSGMETMSGAASGLCDIPAFQQLFLAFQNPALGVAAGTALTAIIQSSSASIGILQALAATGQVTYGAAIPIIMGQNIGTCVTAMVSAVGANKNAKRAAMIHLSFNVCGTAVWLTVFWVLKAVFHPAFLEDGASLAGIAAAHSAFNILCTLLLFPFSGFLESFVTKIIPDREQKEVLVELDERLLVTPPVALERCREVAAEMAETAAAALKEGMLSLSGYSQDRAKAVREKEEKTDYYEDVLGAYLVKLSTRPIGKADTVEAAKLLKAISDFERIADHGVNILESSEEMKEKGMCFTGQAVAELSVICSAVGEILDLALGAFLENDGQAALAVEPLEQVIRQLKEQMRTRHISRLQQGECTINAGFVWSDLLTNLGRTSAHCSNIAGCLMDIAGEDKKLHEALRQYRSGSREFQEKFQGYSDKYAL